MALGFRTLRELHRIAASSRGATAISRAHRGGPFGRDPRVALAHAESQGAAPGTECPRHAPAESSPVRAGDRAARAARSERSSRALAIVAAICLVIGLWQFGGALYIHAKARVAQALLQTAWLRAQGSGDDVKPWPWADMHPLARLTLPARGVDLLVVEGANGRALAFAPGHVEGSAAPGEPGHAVLSAHRDTHFRFLRDVAIGDEIVVEQRSRKRVRFRVDALRVVHERELRLARDADEPVLTLVTCYPFDAIAPGGPLRYVVSAVAARAAETVALRD